jgi:hypothetical protein
VKTLFHFHCFFLAINILAVLSSIFTFLMDAAFIRFLFMILFLLLLAIKLKRLRIIYRIIKIEDSKESIFNRYLTISRVDNASQVSLFFIFIFQDVVEPVLGNKIYLMQDIKRILFTLLIYILTSIYLERKCAFEEGYRIKDEGK